MSFGSIDPGSGPAMKSGIVALALVGWYLILPPHVNSLSKVDTDAPLKNWKVYEKFGTVQECDKSLSSAQSKYGQTAVAPTIASREVH
jgi:hypothetical protein